MTRDSSVVVKKKLPILLMISGTLLLVGGFMQYFLYPSLRNLIYFGWDQHFYRMFSTFLDPNFFGLFLVLFFIFLISKLFTVKIQDKKGMFVLLFLLSSATFIAIFLTYSRTALIALVCAVLVLFWKRHFWKWIFAFLILGIILSIFTFLLISKHALENNLFRGPSTGARLGSAQDALTIFMDDPIIGVGFNSYRYAMYRHHFQPGSTIQEDHGASGADSSLLLVLATSGLVGGTTFCFFLFIHFKSLILSKNKLGIATFVAFFVGSFFVNGLFYPLLLTWFWVILGITESVSL